MVLIRLTKFGQTVKQHAVALKVHAMLSEHEMVSFCILCKTSFALTPTSFFIVSSSSFDHLPNTLMTILHWLMLYLGYCFLNSHRRGPYLAVFSSSFFPRFSTHRQLISTAQTFFPLWSTNCASTLLALTQYGPRKLEHPNRRVHQVSCTLV